MGWMRPFANKKIEIQVNGQYVGDMKINKHWTPSEIEDAASRHPAILQMIDNGMKEVKRVIIMPSKLVNIIF